MSTSISQDLRCPRCDAHVRAGADWCTLCYQDLRPAVVEPEPEPEPEQAVVEPDAVRPPGSHRAASPDGSSAEAGTPDATSPDATSGSDEPSGVPDTQIAEMLAQLAAESAAPLGSLSSKVTTPGAKAALMIGGSVLATLLAWLLMTLVGSLL